MASRDAQRTPAAYRLRDDDIYTAMLHLPAVQEYFLATHAAVLRFAADKAKPRAKRARDAEDADAPEDAPQPASLFAMLRSLPEAPTGAEQTVMRAVRFLLLHGAVPVMRTADLVQRVTVPDYRDGAFEYEELVGPDRRVLKWRQRTELVETLYPVVVWIEPYDTKTSGIVSQTPLATWLRDTAPLVMYSRHFLTAEVARLSFIKMVAVRPTPAASNSGGDPSRPLAAIVRDQVAVNAAMYVGNLPGPEIAVAPEGAQAQIDKAGMTPADLMALHEKTRRLAVAPLAADVLAVFVMALERLATVWRRFSSDALVGT